MARLLHTILLFTIVMLFALSVCRAQTSMQVALDRLVKDSLLSEKEKGFFLKEYAVVLNAPKEAGQQELTYDRNDQLLGLLVQAKAWSTPGTMGAFSFVAEPASSFGIPLTDIRLNIDRFVKLLFRAGLLSDSTLQELLLKNERNEFGWPFEVANFAYQTANEEYFLRPEFLEKFASALREAKVMSADNYRLLMDKSVRGELHHYTALPAYLDFFRVIGLLALPADSIGRLKALYAATSTVYPGLRYDSIRFEVTKEVEAFDSSFVTRNLITSLSSGGRSYSYSGGYYYLVPERYYAIFNKVLSDQVSPYRLHEVTMDSSHYGIIALTEEQFKQFNWTYDSQLGSYMRVSYEQDSRQLTQQAITDVIRVYDSLGLFTHLSQAGKDSGIAEVQLRELNAYSDILRCFRNIIFDADVKPGIDSGQYGELTREIADVSKGRFRPERIVDGYTYEHPHFTYGFTLHGKVYSAKLFQGGKYLDPRFWELIERAMKENDTHGQFHYVYPSDGYSEIYLTDEQFVFLQAHRLLEFTDPDMKAAP